LNTPAIPGTVMSKGEVINQVDDKIQSTYRSGVRKLLHMMRWTRPELMNLVRELSRFAGRALLSHVMAMYQVMKYCRNAPERALLLKRTIWWDGSLMLLFEITGYSDLDWAKDPITRRSVSGWLTFLFDLPISMKSKMMPIVALSVTEAKLFVATCCAQDILFEMRILESMGLKVKKPMILNVDNKGATDLYNNWRVGGRTRHVKVKQMFWRELKESKIIDTNWIPQDEMWSDIYTKNLPGPLFEKYGSKYVGNYQYMKNENEWYDSQRRGGHIENLRVLVNSTRKCGNQVYNEISTSTSKRRRLRIIRRRLGSIKRNQRTTTVENKYY
jgi:hypothetical protein